MVARIGLGAFEACFGPGIPLYLCEYSLQISLFSILLTRFVQAYFYTKRELGKRMAYYQSCGAIASAFGGLIAFGIQNAQVPIANWKLMFIVEVCLNHN